MKYAPKVKKKKRATSVSNKDSANEKLPEPDLKQAAEKEEMEKAELEKKAERGHLLDSLLSIQHKSAAKLRDEREKHRPGKRILKYYLERCGYETDPDELVKQISGYSAALSFLVATSYTFYIVANGASIVSGLSVLFLTSLVGFWISYLLILTIVFFVLDMIMYRRKTEIENVLADFLQLTSANVHAGMTLDKALWFAIRPRFGVLSKEIEMIAKESASGTPLEESMRKFGERYNSKTLQSTVSLIIEGIQAGGEMGPLLSRISSNIKDNQLMMREMSANVSTYVIFIGAATIFAAPLLMALSYQLLMVISKLSATIDMPTEAAAANSLPMAFSKVIITPGQFQLFSVLCLGVTALFSAMIVSVIQSGDIRGGIKNIFVFIGVTIFLFFIISAGLSGIFSSFF